MISSTKRIGIIGAVGLVISVPTLPQNPELQEKLAAVKQSMAENQQKLRQDDWIETTQLTLKGDAKPATRNSCVYGPDGWSAEALRIRSRRVLRTVHSGALVGIYAYFTEKG